MSRAKLSFGVLGATVLMLGMAAAQGVVLPAGPNREVVSRECQACHDLDMVVGSTGQRSFGSDQAGAIYQDMTGLVLTAPLTLGGAVQFLQ